MRQRILAPIQQLFERDGRVVRIVVDGSSCIVPLAAVLFIITHPYKDRPHPLKFGGQKSLSLEVWDGEEPLTWPRAI